MPDPLSLEGMGDIPDPAGQVGAVPSVEPPAERALTREERRVRAGVALGLALVWPAAVSLVFGLRPDLGSLHVVAPIAAWLVALAVALGVLFRPRARGLPAGVRLVQHAVWIVPAAYVIVAAVVAAPEAEPLTWASIRKCLAVSTLMAAGPLVAATLVLRGAFLSAPGWRGAAVGALAGLSGSIGIHAHCSCQAIGHLLCAHGGAIVVGAALGAGLGAIGGRA